MRIQRVFCVLALLSIASPAAAQTPLATVRGVVRDPSAAPVAGVILALTQSDTGQIRTVTTGAGGEFVVPAVPAGEYRLDAQIAGYRTFSRRLTLQVGQEARADIDLTIGSFSEAVDVFAPALFADPLRTSRGTLVDGRQIGALPLDGRQALELSLLAPGAQPSAQGSAGSRRGDFALNVNGGREDANGFLLDGVLNVDPKLNGLGLALPADAVQEFEIVTSTPDASYGRNAAGHVNLITRSGTDRTAVTVYEFFRDRRLNASNYFAPAGEPAPAYRRSQFGASAGGALAKHRAFFFASYEGARTREGVTLVTNVPTTAERAGDFSQSPFARPIDPYTQLPFPNGRIPADRLSSVGLAIAALYPVPNRSVPFRNYVSSPASTDRRDLGDLRVDSSAGRHATVTLRASFDDRRLFEPFSGPGFAAVPGFGATVPRRALNLLAAERRTLSPTLFNELRIGFTRVASGVFQQGAASLNRQVGLPEMSADSRDWGMSFVTVSGFSPLGHEYNNPQWSATRQIQATDALTWAVGRHVLRAGVEFRSVAQEGYRDVQARGFLTFSDQAPITSNALADLLLGLPVTTGVARLDNRQRLRSHSVGAFVQDSVRLGPDVTLLAGVRYEYNAPAVDADNRAFLFDVVSRSLLPAGSGAMPRGGYAPDRNNWAPRAGLTWDIDGRGRTVVRAGAGFYFDQSSLAPSEGLYFNPPYFDLRLYFPLPGVPLTLDDPFPAVFPFAVPPSATAYQRDFQTARLAQWSLSVQRQFGPSRLVEVAYVGGAGRHLLRGRDINQPAPSAAPYNPRPLPQFADITLLESAARSAYRSLQFSLTQRLSGGVSAVASYTWSSSRDNASGLFASAGDANFPQDSRNPQAEWGRSNFDVRHRLSFGFTCTLPFGSGSRILAGRGWLSALLADWEVTGIVSLQSGRPFTVALSPDFDNSNTGRSSLGFGANDRPNLVGTPGLAHPGPDQWFDVTAFSVPAYGSFGNAGRNILEGPAYANVNLAVLRALRLNARARLQLRLEVFNLLNRANFNLPDSFLGSPTFGQILSAGSPRRLQFGARLRF